jgi:hypothetical protein
MKTRIWNGKEPFEKKVNFIDTNNVVLGYELEQWCCEASYWSISEADGQPIHRGNGGEDEQEREIELEGYVFDPSFIKLHTLGDDDDGWGFEGRTATFRLWGDPEVTPELPDLYLTLVNRHNGYYSHGFTFGKGEAAIKGSL